VRAKIKICLLALGTLYLFACSMFTLCYLWYSVSSLMGFPSWLLICGLGASAWVAFILVLFVIGAYIEG